jgi:polyvinyl alcohol dehydrogenase (cytochrome)
MKLHKCASVTATFMTLLACMLTVSIARPEAERTTDAAAPSTDIIVEESREQEKTAHQFEDSPGKVVFHEHCAQCHENSNAGAPPLLTLRVLSASTVYAALNTGRMRAQAASLPDQQRRQVAEYIALIPLSDSKSLPPKACAAKANWFDRSKSPVGKGWGIDLENTRLIPSAQAGLLAKDLQHLQLKWSFAFPDASYVLAQPLVAGGALFTGSQEGSVYALDAASGCLHWIFKGAAEILGAVVIRESKAGHPTLFFSDRMARAYALDAITGTLIWRAKTDGHPTATTMGTPVLMDNRLYVPVLSSEENAGYAEYSCCTFRGSLVALDATTGKMIWKRYTIPSPSTERFKNADGVAQFGPSGAGVWSSPTIDRKRGQIYLTTGNSYSEPADENSDAVFALDLKSGNIKWHTQTLAGDSWTTWDYLCRHDPQKMALPACPPLKKPGPDIDFTTAPVLVHGKDGKDILVAGRKDGTTFGFDPDSGRILWSTRTADDPDPNAGALYWGLMAEGEKIFVPSVGTNFPNGGNFIPREEDGLYALDASTGQRVWAAKVAADCGRSTACTGVSFAPIGFPGVVFAGGTDGYVRAYDTATGKVLWHFDTAREFKTLNGDMAKGGAIGRSSIMIANGMVYVGSGYSRVPGNVLLAFSIDGK